MSKQSAPQPSATKQKRPRVFHCQLPDRGDGMIHALCGFVFPKRKAIYKQDGVVAERPRVSCEQCLALWRLERELSGRGV